MSDQETPRVSDSTAKLITSNLMTKWVGVGVAHKKAVTDLLKKLVIDLQASKSPSKVIERTIKNLELFYSRKEVRGLITEKTQRRVSFELTFPVAIDDGLGFCILRVEVNARSGFHTTSEEDAILISGHALQRLFQRIGFHNESMVLDEIYSCMGIASAWKLAASESGAVSWPLKSKSGFFVAAGNREQTETTLITWMRPEHLSKKWGQVYESIVDLTLRHAELLDDFTFICEFLKSFPWLMHEHSPGVDQEKLAWNSKDEVSTNQPLVATGPLETYLDETRLDLAVVSNFAGLNFKLYPPPFKLHSQHLGVVVQKRRDGELVVSLRNSWVGTISYISNKKTKQVFPGIEDLFVGDEVAVEVRKITYLEKEKAYEVSLDRAMLSDELWSRVLNKYQIGSVFRGIVFAEVRSDCAIQLEEGVRGLVPKTQVKLFLASKNESTENLLGLSLDFSVVGYKDTHRNLLLEVPGFKDKAFNLFADEFAVGQEIHGKLLKKNMQYSLVELKPDFTAVLHRHNCWGQALPEEGSTVDVIIMFVDYPTQKIFIRLKPPINLPILYQAIPVDDDRWQNFLSEYNEGDLVSVQIISMEKDGYLVTMESGQFGILLFNELAWTRLANFVEYGYKLGDLLDVVISCIKVEKQRVFFSKRLLLPHPLESLSKEFDLNKKHKGTVYKVMNYGYFVSLDEGFDALLHIVNIPKGLTFQEGDSIDVYIEEVDVDKKRVSLSYAT